MHREARPAALRGRQRRRVVERGPRREGAAGGHRTAPARPDPAHPPGGGAGPARTPPTREEGGQVTREITDDILGYGPLEPLLRDDSVTEVMVNNHDRVYVERKGKIEATDATLLDNAHLLRIIDKIVSQVGRRVDEASPMVDARLPDGSRVNAIIPPLS